MKRQPIVIVGASLAGGTAAVTLRDEGFDGDIVLIGAESELPYNRPPLSKGYLRGQDRFSDQLVKPAAYYTEQRIELRLGVRATAIDPTQKLVELEGGERVAYDRLLVTTGGRNRTFSAAAGAQVDNGVLVDERCRTTLPDVFAAGDVTNHLHPIFGRLRVEHWNNGYQHGRAAARSMLGRPEPYDYIHTFWSDQYEHVIEYVGFAASWDRVVFRGRLESRKFLGFYLKDGVVRAAMGLDRGGDPEDPKGDSELKAAVDMVRRRAKIDPARPADESVALRTLAAGGS